MKDSPIPAVVLLALALICGTVLCALGAMTKTEMLPLLGGTVVVAHRMLDGAITRRKAKESDKSSDTLPPASSGIPVVFGMLGGGIAALMATQTW